MDPLGSGLSGFAGMHESTVSVIVGLRKQTAELSVGPCWSLSHSCVSSR